MRKSFIFLAVLFLALGSYACSKDKSSGSGTDSAPSEASTSGIGVPECDEYINKVQKCVEDKVPEAARAMMKQGFEQNQKAWKQAAATPQGKSGLATACKMALDTAKQSMGMYGCTF